MTKLQIMMSITHSHHVKSLGLERFSVITNHKHELIDLQKKYNVLLEDYNHLGANWIGRYRIKNW